jgi:hypothetical protein
MILKLERLSKNNVFMTHLRFDVTPELLFKPRFVSTKDDCGLINETQGFMFYIDYMEKAPSLMLMKTYNLTSKTVGEVRDVPVELLMDAVKKEGVKSITGMYPIDDKLEGWIKKELGITSSQGPLEAPRP